jgi:hypothetical protein
MGKHAFDVWGAFMERYQQHCDGKFLIPQKYYFTAPAILSSYWFYLRYEGYKTVLDGVLSEGWNGLDEANEF